MKISVVVPTYQRPALLLRCVEALCNQELSRDIYEVVVVSDGPDMATKQAIEPYTQLSFPKVHYYFDEFVEFPGWPGLPEQPLTPQRIAPFLQNMQAQKFDIVVQMQGNGILTNSMCMLFDAKKVCGLRRDGEFCPDEDLFPISEDDEHEVIRYLKLSDALNCPRQGTEMEFPISQAEATDAQQMLSTMKLIPSNYICIHPGARDPRRRWHPEYFAFIADRLAAKGFTILLTGSIEEHDILRDVANRMNYIAVNLVEEFGHVGIGELGFILKQSAGLVSNDTGVSHVASALGVPSVIVFSPYSIPSRWAPLDDNRHKIIYHHDSSNMEKVVDIVLCCVGRSLDIKKIHNEHHNDVVSRNKGIIATNP